MAKQFKIIQCAVRAVTCLLGAASVVGIYYGVQSFISSLKVLKQHGESLGLQIASIAILILLIYLVPVVLALLTSKAVWYRVVAISTFFFGIVMMLPSVIIGLHYHPQTWPFFLGVVTVLLFVSIFIYWGAKRFLGKNS